MKRTKLRAVAAASGLVLGAALLMSGPGASLALDVAAVSGVTQTAQNAAATPPVEATVQGTNPHGEGTVLAVSVAGKEAVVVGRSTGEQRPDGSYHGHTTTLGVLGNDVIANDTTAGQTAKGPLAPVQEGVLDPLCQSSGGNVCADVLRADSATTTSGSTNHFRAAGLTLGGAGGVSVVAADSNGNISSDGNCQKAHGDVTLLSLMAGGNPLLDIGQSASDSNACPSGTTVTNSSNPLISAGGQQLPLPGCGANDPGYLLNADPLLAIACNAASQAGAGAIGNNALLATLLASGNTTAGVIAGGATQAAATPPAAATQAVAGTRTAAPRTAATKHAATKNAPAGSGKRAPKPSGTPAAAKAARPLTAAAADKLPYTGTDVVIVLFAACALIALGLGLRGLDAGRRTA